MTRDIASPSDWLLSARRALVQRQKVIVPVVVRAGLQEWFVPRDAPNADIRPLVSDRVETVEGVLARLDAACGLVSRPSLRRVRRRIPMCVMCSWELIG